MSTELSDFDEIRDPRRPKAHELKRAHTRDVLRRPLTGGKVPGSLIVEVFGVPRPQGSLSLFKNKATGGTVAKYSPTVYEWRGVVTAAVRSAYDGPPIEGAIQVAVLFELPRPRGHFGSGRNAGLLRPSAPAYPFTMPDIDKLGRAILDSITAAGTVWRDDAQVTRLTLSKIYADGESVPGATITICEARQ